MHFEYTQSVIPREMSEKIQALSRQFPIIIINGPRQAGKTTLIKSLYPELPYENLERPDVLARAQDDPSGFLLGFKDGRGIIDEAQKFPGLSSWLQALVDEDPSPGRFFLTGSNQPLLKASLSQTLAGRAAYVSLPPFTARELERAGAFTPRPEDSTTLYKGFFPPIHDRPFDPTEWFAQYVLTYLERDVNQLAGIKDHAAFHAFIRLCAGRTGQVLNISDLARDADVSHTTARQWLSILEACFLIKLVPPWHENYSKRLVKSPKLYFTDVGLAGYLIGIREASQWADHPLRGAFFETMAALELIKRSDSERRRSEWHFWSASSGLEVDLVEARGDELHAYEIKAAKGFKPEHVKNLEAWSGLAGIPPERCHLLNGGSERFIHRGIEVRPWHS